MLQLSSTVLADCRHRNTTRTMTTNPTLTRCTVRPTGAVVARATGFGAAAGTWFAAGTAFTAHKAHKANTAHTAYAAIATYSHRRPGEDALH